MIFRPIRFLDLRRCGLWKRACMFGISAFRCVDELHGLPNRARHGYLNGGCGAPRPALVSEAGLRGEIGTHRAQRRSGDLLAI
jgi:hypothetical protein